MPVASFLAFFSGTTWGAGTSSPAKQASAGSSGKGAGQIVCSAFFICIESNYGKQVSRKGQNSLPR